MVNRKSKSESRIQLAPERRAKVIAAIKQYVLDEFDQSIGDLRAENLLDFFMREVGAAVYNQGVRDAADFMQEKLTDLDGEVYEQDR